MKIQQLLAPLRRAINQYDMIQSGDKIAVGVSGGKDSLVLLTLLNAFKRFSDRPFDLTAITIDLGFEGACYDGIERYCDEIGVEYVVEKTDIAQVVFDVRKETNPCSLCSKMRRGALNSSLVKHGCNKLALGHHRDDVVETFLLSLFYEGRLSTFAPKSYMSRSGVTLIRPMIFVAERDAAALAQTMPVFKNPCPADKHTQREEMKSIVADLKKKYPDISERLANAIMHPERYNLWDNTEEKFQSQKNTDNR
ncbi:MAG: tRNA 2-thiocytidine(32) synthetase TtcA [Corallococcus sp.]|nr:tRNA 2-thiocytidine(32) synthetase TtcA [Corallococcus sp.]